MVLLHEMEAVAVHAAVVGTREKRVVFVSGELEAATSCG